MRGADERTESFFSYARMDARVPRDHPLRRIRELANGALAALAAKFERLYSRLGRPSIPPERLLRASLLQLLYAIRSERQLMERLEFDLLFRWFVGLAPDEAVWDATSFTKNRDWVLNEAIAQAFLTALLDDPKVKRLLSHEHFTEDGTLLKAWASLKSFRRKDGADDPPAGGRNGERNFRGEQRSNETHASTTAPEARLYRKGNGQESRLCYMGHVLMENRHGLALQGEATQATGTAEREAALAMLDSYRGTRRRITLGGDKAYDVAAFIDELRGRNVTPHIAIDGHLSTTGTPRGTAIDARTTRHPGYAASQVIRKRVEEIFGWNKVIGGLSQLKLRGLDTVKAKFTLSLVACDLLRIPKLLAAP